MRMLGRKWIRRFRRRRVESVPPEEMRTNGKRQHGFEDLVRYMACMGLFTQNIPMMIRPFEDKDGQYRNR